jgi:hypothetical protein
MGDNRAKGKTPTRARKLNKYFSKKKTTFRRNPHHRRVLDKNSDDEDIEIDIADKSNAEWGNR